MDLNKIRNMNDKELAEYLKKISNQKVDKCIKCGTLTTDKAIMIHNKKKMQHKKLCNICDKCYEEMLDFLEIPDIIWD